MKKYLPFVALLAAVILLLWIKTHQRGAVGLKSANESTIASMAQASLLPFDRDASKLDFSRHARCRMDCRHIYESEVHEILENGEVNYAKVEESPKGKTYPLEGITHDKQHVRIVFAPHDKNQLMVITVIDLDKDWPCECGNNYY